MHAWAATWTRKSASILPGERRAAEPTAQNRDVCGGTQSQGWAPCASTLARPLQGGHGKPGTTKVYTPKGSLIGLATLCSPSHACTVALGAGCRLGILALTELKSTTACMPEVPNVEDPCRTRPSTYVLKVHL